MLNKALCGFRILLVVVATYCPALVTSDAKDISALLLRAVQRVQYPQFACHKQWQSFGLGHTCYQLVVEPRPWAAARDFCARNTTLDHSSSILGGGDNHSHPDVTVSMTRVSDLDDAFTRNFLPTLRQTHYARNNCSRVWLDPHSVEAGEGGAGQRVTLQRAALDLILSADADVDTASSDTAKNTATNIDQYHHYGSFRDVVTNTARDSTRFPSDSAKARTKDTANGNTVRYDGKDIRQYAAQVYAQETPQDDTKNATQGSTEDATQDAAEDAGQDTPNEDLPVDETQCPVFDMAERTVALAPCSEQSVCAVCQHDVDPDEERASETGRTSFIGNEESPATGMATTL